MPEKYEIEHVRFDGLWIESEIGMLTGLGLGDILKVTGKITHWSGQTFVRVFHQLGYNCNQRFVKFDKQTPYPCMMRCNKVRVKENCWYGFVYYDGFVYLVDEGKITWAEWNKLHPDLRVTSMLQVWI
jgi:hypothetical protein